MSILSLDKAKNLQINAAGYNITLAQGMSLPKRSHESVAAMQAVVEEIEKNPQALTAEIKTALKSSIKQLEALGANPKNIGLIDSALNYTPAKGAIVEVITADLMKNPLARKMLSVEDLGKLGIAGDKIAELDKRISARSEIASLLEKGKKLDADGLKKLQSILGDHYGAPKEVKGALIDFKGNTKFLHTELKETHRLIAEGIDNFKNAAQNLQSIDDKIINAKANGHADKVIEALEKQKGRYERIIQKATDSKLPYAGKILEVVEKDTPELFETAKSATKGLGSHIDTTLKAAKQAVEGGAKSTGGNKFFSLFHGTDALAEKAKTLKVKPEELKFHQKIRPGKAAAVAGIAAIGAYFLAGTGNKPGKHTEAVLAQQQGAEPAMGR